MEVKNTATPNTHSAWHNRQVHASLFYSCYSCCIKITTTDPEKSHGWVTVSTEATRRQKQKAERKYSFTKDKKKCVTDEKTIRLPVQEKAKATELSHVNIHGWTFRFLSFDLSDWEKRVKRQLETLLCQMVEFLWCCFKHLETFLP